MKASVNGLLLSLSWLRQAGIVAQRTGKTLRLQALAVAAAVTAAVVAPVVEEF
jgi:hypothetical protein